jgi:acetyl esterase/lipase
MGDSAGGAIAASIVMDKDFVNRYQIKTQVLIYPSLDYTMGTDSLAEYATGYMLEEEKIEWYVKNYLQHNENRKTVSPLHNNVYIGMPKTLVIVAKYDPLRDEGILYYEKVKTIGIDAELIQVDGVIHAFFLMEDLCQEQCNMTYTQISEFLNS